MAEIVLGIASSHAPQLEMLPGTWRAYGDRGRTLDKHWFEGNTYSFGELVELRAADHFEKECTEEKFETRFNACQQAIAHLSETIAKAAPDVLVILGDDQHESFQDDNLPAFCIYYGESVDDSPRISEHRAAFGDPKIANRPSRTLAQPTDAALGEYLIETLIENEFDVTRSNKLPVGRGDGAIGHAFYYVYRRLMDNHPVPSVPLMVNTYYPPNAPTAKRCYDFGAAVIASGGLSHTVIEEDLDARILDGLRHDDKEKLLDYADVRFRGGTSEIKNWIALGGAVAPTGLRMEVVDYVPCYRTEAGNGCAMGFAEWV
ncbi:MAG: protocatechuate 3,4-dioxygenase [Chloroflexi bacterium]|nr:protocatechuate 3,4-dioxygenase [Chloroflexota bacterium]